MRNPVYAPTLVPSFDVTVYLVLDDFGKIGRAYREADEVESDLEDIVGGMLNGRYTQPIRVVAFNTAELLKDGQGTSPRTLRGKCSSGSRRMVN
jgi:hypothetical protein